MSVLDPDRPLEPSAERAEPTTSRTRLASRLRQMAIGGVSLMVLLALGAFLLVSPRAQVDLEVHELDGPVAYDVDLSGQYSLAALSSGRARSRSVLYGRVSSPHGVPVRDIRITLSGAEKKVRGQRVSFVLGRPRAYRAVVRLRPGSYRLTVEMVAARKRREVSKVVRLRDGRSYEAVLRVRESGVLTMLPISSY